MAEQYPHQADYEKTLPTGERVIVEREGDCTIIAWARSHDTDKSVAATLQLIMSTAFMSINFGAFVALGSTFAEKVSRLSVSRALVTSPC